MVYDALGDPMHARLLHGVATHQRAEFEEKKTLKQLHA